VDVWVDGDGACALVIRGCGSDCIHRALLGLLPLVDMASLDEMSS
jgi:hypothetical protein